MIRQYFFGAEESKPGGGTRRCVFVSWCDIKLSKFMRVKITCVRVSVHLCACVRVSMCMCVSANRSVELHNLSVWCVQEHKCAVCVSAVQT